jgi:hypothetical protein
VALRVLLSRPKSRHCQALRITAAQEKITD